MSDKTTVQVLRDARALVAQGWTQGEYLNDDGVCAVGAIERVTGATFDTPTPDYVAARSSLVAVVGRGVIGWNDEDGRTQAEVLAAFDRAIALAEDDDD